MKYRINVYMREELPGHGALVVSRWLKSQWAGRDQIIEYETTDLVARLARSRFLQVPIEDGRRIVIATDVIRVAEIEVPSE